MACGRSKMERNSTKEKKVSGRVQMKRSHASAEKQRSVVCQWIGYGRVMKSITARRNHKKIHRANRKEEALCEWRSIALRDRTSLTSHQKQCTGATKGICPFCGEMKSTRHKRSCAMGNERKEKKEDLIQF